MKIMIKYWKLTILFDLFYVVFNYESKKNGIEGLSSISSLRNDGLLKFSLKTQLDKNYTYLMFKERLWRWEAT